MKPTEEELILLSMAIAEIPPQELSHLDSWQGIKDFFQCIELELQSFYGGRSSPVNYVSDKTEEYIKAWRDVYRALYDVIYDSFDDITKMLKEICHPWFATPGMVLIQIIEEDSLGALQIAQGKRLSPRTLYEFHRLESKAKLGKASKKEQIKLAKPTKLFLKQIEKIAYTRDFVVHSAKLFPKNKPLQMSLENYYKRRDYFESLSGAMFRKQMRRN